MMSLQLGLAHAVLIFGTRELPYFYIWGLPYDVPVFGTPQCNRDGIECMNNIETNEALSFDSVSTLARKLYLVVKGVGCFARVETSDGNCSYKASSLLSLLVKYNSHLVVCLLRFFLLTKDLGQ